MSVAGRKLAEISPERWLHVEIEAPVGPSAARRFRLTLTPAGGPAQSFADLPMPGAEFRELHWLGFSSTAAADTAFYLDNLTFGPVPANGSP